MAKSLKSKKSRNEYGAFMVDGTKCVGELISHMPNLLKSLIVIEGQHKDIADLAANMKVEVYPVKQHVMNAISDCKTSQGVAAIATYPSYIIPKSGFILALDGVADPQNVGTMIRTADAAGCAGVVMSDSCADFLSPKSVRASMGSVFHLPIVKTDLLPYLSELRSNGYRIAAAHMSGQSDFDLPWQSCCLVIGNEARGVCEPITALATDHVSIPMFGSAESLNAAVAAGILIYKIRN
jgi:RNA methyltransferase, TrmH family